MDTMKLYPIGYHSKIDLKKTLEDSKKVLANRGRNKVGIIRKIHPYNLCPKDFHPYLTMDLGPLNQEEYVYQHTLMNKQKTFY